MARNNENETRIPKTNPTGQPECNEPRTDSPKSRHFPELQNVKIPWASRPREFHPRPLRELDVNLSAHPAPIIQTTMEWFCYLQRLLRSNSWSIAGRTALSSRRGEGTDRGDPCRAEETRETRQNQGAGHLPYELTHRAPASISTHSDPSRWAVMDLCAPREDQYIRGTSNTIHRVWEAPPNAEGCVGDPKSVPASAAFAAQ